MLHGSQLMAKDHSLSLSSPSLSFYRYLSANFLLAMEQLTKVLALGRFVAWDLAVTMKPSIRLGSVACAMLYGLFGSVCSVRSSDIIICWFWAIEAVSSSVTTAQRIAWLLLFFGYLFFNLNSFIILTCFGYAWFAYSVKYVPIKIAKNMIKTVCKFWWKHTNLFISQNEQQQKSANW